MEEFILITSDKTHTCLTLDLERLFPVDFPAALLTATLGGGGLGGGIFLVVV